MWWVWSNVCDGVVCDVMTGTCTCTCTVYVHVIGVVCDGVVHVCDGVVHVCDGCT